MRMYKQFGIILALLFVLTLSSVMGANEMRFNIANKTEKCGTFALGVVTTESNVIKMIVELNNTIVSTTTNTSANQTSWSLSVPTTTAISSGKQKITALLNVTQIGDATSAAFNTTNIDNKGPVLSFAAANTANGIDVASEDFVVSITSDENLARSYVTIGGKVYNLINSSTVAAAYSFSENEVPDFTYDYVVTGIDNTTCGNTATLTRNVNIDLEKKSVAHVASVTNTSNQANTSMLILAAVAIWFFFIKKK